MNGGPTYEPMYFGDPWPEVEAFKQVPAPAGMLCGDCGRKLTDQDQGTYRTVQAQDHLGTVTTHLPVHRGCGG